MTAVAPEVDALLGVDPDAELVRNGRYYIVPAGATDGKARAHTRVTNFARELEDTFSLVQWQKRQVLLGTAQRRDIAVAALANSDEPKKLNDLAESAMDAAEANAARETGSALHRLCERADMGEALELPEPWASDLAAYKACLAADEVEILPEYVEGVVVHPGLKLAGRFDRIVRYGNGLVICDLKTGVDLSYSWGSIAIQLALYASAATIYDPATRTHAPMPQVAQDYGLVLHLPAGSGLATLHAVDLAAGRRGIDLVKALKGYRKDASSIRCTLAEASPQNAFLHGIEPEPEPVAPEEPAVPTPELRGYVEWRVRDLIKADLGADLASRWPDHVATLKAAADHTTAQLDLILAACNEVDKVHGRPFPEHMDPRHNPTKELVSK